ncbi:MAG: 2-amino-4-hydroxy-6-hydroxymethyldihydropteridine diphosphokinase, partial [Xanthomonadales bacterium]|nr:2-amino-4-hydroxy-6-hydroxymethyldihydropteridine diphosphokinase [Xanthomonadales bacterium]NIX11516.1 2-amino-4-hydroxy-6-hydroxymethyldihydropteridine diphosphokinase [Xanthomonadales bacterium]
MNAWIGLGGNIGDSAAKIGAALASIRNHRDIGIVRSSALYRSEPWGHRQQAPFTNAVAELDTALTPRELLVELANLELQLGRVPHGRRWGPRVIDLDILLVGDRIIVLEDLVVPHPRMHRRA